MFLRASGMRCCIRDAHARNRRFYRPSDNVYGYDVSDAPDYRRSLRVKTLGLHQTESTPIFQGTAFLTLSKD